jgi:hypothetical protein
VSRRFYFDLADKQLYYLPFQFQQEVPMSSCVPVPAPPPAASTIARDGKKLIVPNATLNQMVTLPPPCVKCGASADGNPVIKTFSWHHPALYLLILLGILPGLVLYTLIASSKRRKIFLCVPLCTEHARRRRLIATLAWIIPAIGLAAAFILPHFGMDISRAGSITVVLIISGVVLLGVTADPIRPRYIDQFRAVFTGVCEKYLQQLPPGRA